MRLPKFAELSFARASAAADAFAHPPDEDQNGWDYLVEFEARKFSGPADEQPPATKAFVQIKSSQRTKLSCRVKLSNALKATQSRDPWFIVLMISQKGSREPLVYATHVWRDIMEQTLRAVRVAEKEGIALHRRCLTLSFSRTDLWPEDKLIEWMRDCIDEVPAYSLQKQKLHETLGFENGKMVGSFSFVVDNADDIFENFLEMEFKRATSA